ncbi:MAG: hypothetical protein E7508_08160 [Ruminococcus sp.]|nr:hypothetical protein [Ruminococcus sp.]
MQILKNLSRAELDYLTGQPTAKALIEKNKSSAINIPKGDAKAAAEFVAARKREKQEDSFQLSDAGLAVLKKSLEKPVDNTELKENPELILYKKR